MTSDLVPSPNLENTSPPYPPSEPLPNGIWIAIFEDGKVNPDQKTVKVQGSTDIVWYLNELVDPRLTLGAWSIIFTHLSAEHSFGKARVDPGGRWVARSNSLSTTGDFRYFIWLHRKCFPADPSIDNRPGNGDGDATP